MTDNRLQRLSDAFATHAQVRAVALAGSRTLPHADSASDYDIYVYLTEALPVKDREAIITPLAQTAEIDNHYWETGDEWLAKEDGLKFDVMYRDCGWIAGEITRVMTHHQASVGYSTALVHNVVHSQILFDRDGWFADLQIQANTPYPDALQRAIIAKNYPILRTTLSSYVKQIDNAIKRDDPVSVNHRVTALLTSYFDVLFALNKVHHPGEKRLLAYVDSLCEKQPQNVDTHIRYILQQIASPSEALLDIIHTLLNGLDVLLTEENLMP